jgi:Iron-containing redox enzyme
MKGPINPIVADIIKEEEVILRELLLENELTYLGCGEENLKRFAQTFYFIRYDFCRLNFIVGERCGIDERLWSGLARNLYEELGGKSGVSHNKLYQNFLDSVGCHQPELTEQPEFTYQFNRDLESYCREAPLPEALSAIAIYEIFDIPDYQLLLRVMKKSGVPQRGLKFFQVHAVANHFELFEDIIPWLREQDSGEDSFNRAKDFVFHTQTKMWRELVEYLQQ